MKTVRMILLSMMVCLFAISLVSAQSWQMVYGTEFGNDPGWTTNSPSNFYWDATDSTYSACQYNVNYGGNYTGYEVGYDGGSFRLGFDILVESEQYCSDLSFGIFDADFNTSYPCFVRVSFTHHDGGKQVFLAYRSADSSYGYFLDTSTQWVIDTTYRVSLEYDAEFSQLTVDIRYLDGSPFTSFTEIDVAPFALDMGYIGSSNIRDSYFQCPGYYTCGRFDNVRYYLECGYTDAFDDGSIDPTMWNTGCCPRGTWPSDPCGTGPWTCDINELTDPSDGYLQLEVLGPTSGNTFGAEAWVMTEYDYNDGLNHLINFDWESNVLIPGHYDYLYVQITDGFIPDPGNLHWPDLLPPGTHDFLWRDYGTPPGPGTSYANGLPRSNWSMIIRSSGLARLYDGPYATGNLIYETNLDFAYAWHFRLMIIDGTSAGFPAGHDQVKLYSFTSECTCCVGIRGNVDYDPGDNIDISDLVYLVDYMFTGGPPPPCIEEADMNCDGSIDISDLVWLVDYMFTGGPPPCRCDCADCTPGSEW